MNSLFSPFFRAMLNFLSHKKQIGDSVCVYEARAFSHFFCLRTVTVSSRGKKSVVKSLRILCCVCVHVCYTKTPSLSLSLSLSLSSNFVGGGWTLLFSIY